MLEEKNQNRLYIGNLDYGATEEDITQAFSEKGIDAKEVRIIKDKFSGRSKGFGFAEVDTAEKIQEAISALDGQDLKGRRLRVSQAKEREPRSDREFKPRRFGGSF
jgi:RNA recognition motif-containing protein